MTRLSWGALWLLVGLVGCTNLLQPPAPPTSFVARAVSWSRVELEWEEVNGASVYLLERKTGVSDDSGFSRLGVLPAAQHGFSDSVSPATTYTYRLRASNSVGESPGVVQTVTVPAAPPENPASFVAEAPAPDRVVLSWSEGAGATGYRLERSSAGALNYAQVGLLGASARSYTDTSVAADTAYTYRLVAINPSGTSPGLTRAVRTPAAPSPPSAPSPLPAVPPTPTAFSAVAVSQEEVRLRWQAAPGAEEYRLERSSGAGGFQPLGKALGTVYSDTAVSPGSVYAYRLVAANAGGVSEAAEAGATTPPAAPTSFTATAVSSAQIALTWTPSSGATAYRLERKIGPAESPGGYVSLNLGSRATAYSDDEVEASTVYTYRLWASNAGGDSPTLLRTLRTPAPPPPGPPRGFAGTSTASSITLNWEGPAGGGPLTTYRLERGLGASPASFTPVYEGSAPAFTDWDVAPATLYTYRLRSRGPGGESGVLSTSLATAALPVQPLRVLFIGNSLTEYPDLPGKVAWLAEAAGEPRGLESERVIRLGQSLSDHWNAGTDPETARGRIAECTWDVVVLQERSYTPLVETVAFRQAVGDFAGLMNACPATSNTRKPKGLLFLNWPNRDYPQITQPDLEAQTFSLADRLGLAVAPVGTAWTAITTRYPELGLYADEVHPSLLGGYLEADVLYSSLYGRPAPWLEGELDAATAANLAGAAWEAVSGLGSAYRLPAP